MVTGNNGMPGAKAGAECVNPYPCERDDGCESDDTSFFPSTACGELEVSLSFPTCWDGINVDSDDHQSHVSYDLDGGVFGTLNIIKEKYFHSNHCIDKTNQ